MRIPMAREDKERDSNVITILATFHSIVSIVKRTTDNSINAMKFHLHYFLD